MMTRAAEELSRAVTSLVIQEPFYGHVLSGVVREFSSQVPTAGVGWANGRLRLVVNPDFFLKSTRKHDERVGVIKHETLHIVFKHLLRAKGFDPNLFNIAADLVVNQYVAPWKLPSDAVTIESLGDDRFKPDQTAEWYYEQLTAPDLADQTQRLLEGLLGQSNRRQDHSGWDAASDADQLIAPHLIDQHVVRAAQRCGSRGHDNLPNAVRAAIQACEERERPQIEWRRVLRIFAASSRRSRVRPTMLRPSKRYQTFPGNKVRRFSRLLVAIDTSASVSSSHIADFFAEIRAIFSQGAEVQVLECDQTVQRVYPYVGQQPSIVDSRGGTCFDPVFRWMRDQDQRWDGCIYLTDGLAPAPTLAPPCPLLWVVTSDGSVGSHLRFGRCIQLTKV